MKALLVVILPVNYKKILWSQSSDEGRSSFKHFRIFITENEVFSDCSFIFRNKNVSQSLIRSGRSKRVKVDGPFE